MGVLTHWSQATTVWYYMTLNCAVLDSTAPYTAVLTVCDVTVVASRELLINRPLSARGAVGVTVAHC
jgi:hypothetical protein